MIWGSSKIKFGYSRLCYKFYAKNSFICLIKALQYPCQVDSFDKDVVVIIAPKIRVKSIVVEAQPRLREPGPAGKPECGPIIPAEEEERAGARAEAEGEAGFPAAREGWQRMGR